MLFSIACTVKVHSLNHLLKTVVNSGTIAIVDLIVCEVRGEDRPAHPVIPGVQELSQW